MINLIKNRKFIVSLLILFVGQIVVFSSIAANGSESNKIGKKTIKAIVKKTKPLIEEVTGRKFKKRVKFKIVDRTTARDEIVENANLDLFRKLMPTASEDDIARQIEADAAIAIQGLLGLYVPKKKQLLIIPENAESNKKADAIGEDVFEDFVFLLVTHEMVHMLDDQYFDLEGMRNAADDTEELNALFCLIEGNAVYVTDQVAESLKIPEAANIMAQKSAAGYQAMEERIQAQTIYQKYTKGAEFVLAIMNAKGTEGISEAFASPPLTTRQIMNPEIYLNPNSVKAVDCSWLLEDISEKLPVDGMKTQSVEMGTMALNTGLVAMGISEEEAGAVANDCLNGAAFIASKQSLKPKTVIITAVDFANRESAEKMFDVEQKITQSQQAQVNAKLNATCTVVEDTAIAVQGFDRLQYRHVVTEENQVSTTAYAAEGLMGSVYIEAAFVNMESVVNREKICEMMKSLSDKKEGMSLTSELNE